ncbi:MAG: hypothetical protein A3K19_05315 [Lentisphaerae bacterium RIFOXYB12_FULL_65_16]|nr:MAG: hypothetical protein A3K18_02525 [Lentisphaerae bacterium RIFOXYA12_64_32]OGV84155.1 MAG: hypothetical protein A3K19_05315 [Lentisphaerae bacterium RIFOXYB12_FULL_65_16]
MAVCLKHTDREATTKCATCFKPLCEECAKPADGHVFCSEQCQQNFAASAGRMAAVAARDRAAARRKLIKRLVILLVLIAAGAAAYVFLKKDPDMAERLKREAESLQNKVEKGAKDVGRKLQD